LEAGTASRSGSIAQRNDLSVAVDEAGNASGLR